MAHLGTSMCIGVVLPQHIDVGEDEALALLAPARGARRARGSARGSGRPQSGRCRGTTRPGGCATRIAQRCRSGAPAACGRAPKRRVPRGGGGKPGRSPLNSTSASEQHTPESAKKRMSQCPLTSRRTPSGHSPTPLKRGSSPRTDPPGRMSVHWSRRAPRCRPRPRDCGSSLRTHSPDATTAPRSTASPQCSCAWPKGPDRLVTG